MRLTETCKYVFKVWSTTLLVGTVLTMSYFYFFTQLMTEIKNVMDLYVRAFMMTLFLLLVTLPVAFVFYTLTEIIVQKVSLKRHMRVLLVINGAILTGLFFILAFQQRLNFLWNETPLMIFFYCYVFILIISIFAYKLKDTVAHGQD